MYSFPSSRLYPDILNPNLNVYRYPRCVSVLPETYVFLWLLGNLPSFFWNAAISVTGISNSCTKKFLPSDYIRKSAISKEGWPDGKESDCFPGQSGGRGETPEESKWGWTAQKAKKLRSVSGTSYGTIFNETVLLFSCALPRKIPRTTRKTFHKSEIFCFSLFYITELTSNSLYSLCNPVLTLMGLNRIWNWICVEIFTW